MVRLDFPKSPRFSVDFAGPPRRASRCHQSKNANTWRSVGRVGLRMWANFEISGLNMRPKHTLKALICPRTKIGHPRGKGKGRIPTPSTKFQVRTVGFRDVFVGYVLYVGFSPLNLQFAVSGPHPFGVFFFGTPPK